MFDLETGYDPSWMGSFVLQQIIVIVLLPPVGMLVGLMTLVPVTFIIAPFLISVGCGYFIHSHRPGVKMAGRWVWIIPTLLMAWNISNWIDHVPLREALEYSFWPGPNSGERGLEALLIIPMLASWGYVVGLFISAKRPKNSWFEILPQSNDCWITNSCVS